MTKAQLTHNIQEKKSFLCVGLDTDPDLIPNHLRGKEDGVLVFNKTIIEATKDLCVAYKINTAFYEALGSKGWAMMEDTVKMIPNTHLKIADAKRADIGNTSTHYAKAFFESMAFDAVTVAPYMGEDSVRPFLEYENKWTIVLGLTSNPGAKDFELQQMGSGEMLYERVIAKIAKWGTADNLMFVVGATQESQLEQIRKIVPDNFLLVPGIGFQGGSLSAVCEKAMNKDVGLLVNASRAIIYASEDEKFAAEAKAIALEYQTEMAVYLSKFLLE